MKYSWIGIFAAAFLVFLPFFLSSDIFYGTANAKFFWVVGLCVVLAGIAGVKLLQSEKQKVRVPWVLLAGLGVFLGVHILSAQLGVFPERSWWSDILRSTGVLFLVHLSIFAVLLGAYAKAADWSLIRRGVLIGAGLFSFGTIVGVGGFGYEGWFLGLPFEQEGFTLGNSTFSGTYLALAVMLGLVELVRSWSDTRWRNISIGLLGIILLSPTLLHVREFLTTQEITGLMGAARASSVTIYTFLAFFAGWVLLPKVFTGKILRIVRGVWAGAFLLGVGTIIGLLFVPGSVVQQQYIELSSAARLIVWESGIEAAQDRLGFGYGPENFNHAFESHHDSRLYLKENLAEIWFDRAHNVFVDTLVTLGVFGMFGMAVVLALFVFVVLKVRKRGVISNLESVVLIGVVPVHLIQLQTGFDTIASYVLLAVFLGYGLYLERESREDKVEVSGILYKILGSVLLLGVCASAWFVLGQEQVRQHALRDVFRAENMEQEHELIRASLTRVSDFESIRLTADSFIAGGLDAIAETQSQETVQRVQQTIPLYEDAWRRYIEAQPDHYRARINIAYLLLVKTILGEPGLEEVDVHVARAYELSPGNPLTFIVDGLSHLYRGDIKTARERIDAAVAIDPNIRLSQAVADYLDVQEAQFPRIELFRLESL